MKYKFKYRTIHIKQLDVVLILFLTLELKKVFFLHHSHKCNP